MTLWPVIVRELRAESRHPINCWLRVGGAASLMLVCVMVWGSHQAVSIGEGARLFSSMNAVLLAAIWLFAPLLTADCISGEKREGTLGLLFLTALKARDIVVAKMLTHALRATTIVLAVLPVVMIPILLGGVTWHDALRAALLDFAALALALTAGVLASSFSREWLRAMLLALALSFGCAFLFVSVHGYFRVHQMLGAIRGPTTFSYFWTMFWSYLWSRWGRLPLGPGNPYAASGPWTGGGGSTDPMGMLIAGGLLGMAVLAAIVVILVAARRIQLAWRDEPRSPRQLWLRQTFCTPVIWRSFFRQSMRRTMERNPISWLQQHTWSARLTKWGWLMAVVVFETMLLFQFSPGTLWFWQDWLINLLGAGMAFSAVSSFRQERENGVLELLLVAPLTEKQIIAGRMMGIWKQFLPVIGFLIFYYFFLIVQLSPLGRPHLYPGGLRFNAQIAYSTGLMATYLTVPIIGLYFAMRRMNFIAAWLLTCVVGMMLPWVCGVVIRILEWRYYHFVLDANFSVLAGLLSLPAKVTFQFVLARIAWGALHRLLTQRKFLLA